MKKKEEEEEEEEDKDDIENMKVNGFGSGSSGGRGRSSLHLDGIVSGGSKIMSREEEERRWVIVFGFPPSLSSSVLSLIHQHATPLVHIDGTSRGGGSRVRLTEEDKNWMALKFSSHIEASSFLGLEGEVVGGNTLIGVLPYTPTLGRRLGVHDAVLKEDKAMEDDWSGGRSRRGRDSLEKLENQFAVTNRSLAPKFNKFSSKYHEDGHVDEEDYDDIDFYEEEEEDSEGGEDDKFGNGIKKKKKQQTKKKRSKKRKPMRQLEEDEEEEDSSEGEGNNFDKMTRNDYSNVVRPPKRRKGVVDSVFDYLFSW